jgi:phosphoribosylformimino-5-aminoimidazole carboxamide ribotide isomerase
LTGKGGSPGAFEVLPAIDVRGGRVVRLLRGDRARATTYAQDAAGVADGFVARGARWLHVVDLDGARDPLERQTRLLVDIVGRVGDRASVEVAGGLRDVRAVEACLRAGAARVVLGTAALDDPSFAGRLAAEFGPRRVAVALDVRDGLAVGHGWIPGAPGVAVDAALEQLAGAGVTIFEVTAIDRDGTLAGPDLVMLERIVRQTPGDVIASGGISNAADMAAVRALGCRGAILGRALYEGTLSLEEALAAAR